MKRQRSFCQGGRQHINLTSTGTLNHSFTFLLRANYVQQEIVYLPFTIVPPDPSLLQAFTADVLLFVTEDHLVTSVLSQEKPVVSSGLVARTETLGKLTQTRWQKTHPGDSTLVKRVAESLPPRSFGSQPPLKSALRHTRSPDRAVSL
uniref:Uncharacterized protein n=1 Tax=Callithrix jacchus TaxID=9483 RepID=A0A8I3WHQ8_CALJA